MAAVLVAGLALGLGSALPAAAQQDPGGTFLDEANPCPPGVEVGPAPFSDRDDVPPDHLLTVDCAAALEILQGREDGSLQPVAPTRRDQMASLIVRSLEAAGYDLPAPSDQGFGDIAGNVHADAVNQLAAAGIARGTSDTTFSPDAPVRRDQMASFLVRAAQFAFGDTTGFAATQPGRFADVPPDNVHRASIDAAAEVLRLSIGTAGGENFDPDGLTRRDQMATFLIRTVDLILMPDMYR